MEPDLSSDEHILTIASFARRVYVSTVLRQKQLLVRNTLLNVTNALVFTKLKNSSGNVTEKNV